MASFTGNINTEGQFESVATLTDLSITSGKTYTLQVRNFVQLRLGDGIIDVNTTDPFTYVAGSDDLEINTPQGATLLTVIEAA